MSEKEDLTLHVLDSKEDCIVHMRREAQQIKGRFKTIGDSAFESIESDLAFDGYKDADDEFEGFIQRIVASYILIEQLGKLWQAELKRVLFMFPEKAVAEVRKDLEIMEGYQYLAAKIRDIEHKNSMFVDRVKQVIESLKQEESDITH